MCSFILLLVCASVTYTRSAKILCVYTTPGHSHVKVFGLLTEELAKNGHELVVLKRGKYENNFGNATLIHLEDIAKFKQLDMLKNFRKPMKGNVLDPKFSAWTISRILHELIDVQLSSPIVQAVLNDSRNFDLIIVEGMFRCGLMFSTKFQVPLVLVTSSLGTINDYETIGSYVHPLFYPDLYMISERQQSVWNRILSLYNFIRLQKISDDLAAIENIKIKQRFDENSITIQDLQNRVQMLFLNVDRIWDYNRPMPPSGFNIGAIHLRPPIPLNDNLTQYFDNSQNGVIYVSMGTFSNMSEVPPDKVVLMTNVLKSLPYDILWKWDDDKLADQNIRYEKWVPQLDVLYHPKLKAFVSHAGLLSTTEAIAANIPLIGLPLRMDQFMNARKFGQFGIGVHFDLKTVTEEELKSGIIDVIADKSYRENIRKLHVILEEQRSGALQRAVRVIERVAKFGGDHLRSPAAMISFAEAAPGEGAPGGLLAAEEPQVGEDGEIIGGPRTPQQIAAQKRLQQTRAQVDEVVDIMKTNVEKVLDRDAKLSELDDRADALQQGASQFEQQAKSLKNKFWLQNLKMMIIMGVIGIVIIGLLFVRYRGTPTMTGPPPPVATNSTVTATSIHCAQQLTKSA